MVHGYLIKEIGYHPAVVFLVLSGISIAIGTIGILAHQHVLDNVWKNMTGTSLPDLIKQIPDAVGGKDLVVGVGIVLIGAPRLIYLVKMAKSYRAEKMSLKIDHKRMFLANFFPGRRECAY